MKYVIDASVILEGLLNPEEKVRKKIFKFLEKNEKILTSTDFLNLEVLNVILKRISNTELQKIIINLFHSTDIELFRVEQIDVNSACEIAINFNTTVYDSSYHAFAIRTGSTFLTLDKKYYNKTKHIGHIKLLHD